MSYLPWVSILLLALAVVIIGIAGKPKWDAYVKMARLRPVERILHEEKNVRIRTKAWAAFPWFDWTYAGGGPLEYGWVTADVIITNQRILVFAKGVPISIVDFTLNESLPSSWWLPFRQWCLLNVTKSDIRVTTDESGKPCLEVVYEGRKGHGIRTRYYLRELEVATALFPDTERDLVQV